MYEKIILCSAHGTSRLDAISHQTKFDTSFPADRDDEKTFPTALESDDKIIFADYSRFIQKGIPGSEIHGGATWEEIFVPVKIAGLKSTIRTRWRNLTTSPRIYSWGS